ncbi:SMC family ATPase [Shewanella sp. JM162201]|uniref:SMC family ATPase n=1 Tax=Shewanella jiangmenensis TaxID=2837387 RepID=A0ABS5V289_9GAMM|nr:SMC family ATPase [Shewanella jiangmenensis]MBT1443158.1 SMC family ATPase [Shewanella jiangmenensis]
MKPLSLEMTAFGPFADCQRIDFSALGDWPLFLINGPTGAGKTTILDGICFALYGKTTGNEREGSQMRCDSAPDDVLTEVIFEFALGGREYRIKRIPEQPRAKKSGDGFTLQKSEAFLERIDGDKTEPLAVGKVTEVTAMIEDLLGLEVEQFRQVMVLPQGQFRKLLLADSKEREAIFGQLFQTGIYKRIEDSLKQRALELKARAKELEARRAGILETAGAESLDALNAMLAALAPELDMATTAKQAAELALADARAKRQAAEAKLREFAALNDTKARLAEESAKADEMNALGKQLERAARADSVSASAQAWIERQTELKGFEASFAAATEGAARAAERLALAKRSADELPLLDEKRRSRQNDADKLAEWRPRMARLTALSHTIAGLERSQGGAEAELNHARQTLGITQARINELGVKRRELMQLASSAGNLEAEFLKQTELYQRQQQYQQKAQAATQLAEHLHQLEAEGREAKAIEAQQVEARERLELAWHQGQAAILATKLMPGAPCAVCGSTAHPNPAHHEGTLPSDEEIDRARRAEQQAREALSRARSDYKAQKQRLDGMRAELAADAEQLGNALASSLEQKAAELAVQKESCARAKAAQSTLLGLDDELSALDSAAKQQLSQIEALQARCSAQALELGNGRSERDSLLATMPEVCQRLGSEQAFDAHLLELQGSINQLSTQMGSLQTALVDAQSQHDQCTERREAALKAQLEGKAKADAARARFESELAAKGFVDEQDFIRARMSADTLASAKAAMTAWQERLLGLKERLSAQQEALGDDTPPVMDALVAQEATAQQAFTEATSVWQGINDNQVMLSRARSQLDAEAASSARLDADYALIGTLSDAASGSSGERISLQRFVLGVLLDDVLIEASVRLLQMSKGRYRLIRKEDRAKGNKASGLDLDVEDAYTGKVRPVATLSGGESFMAALALALGLSDVVQAYAGGIKLDTLFIDEGFGSLDQEALELAIRTLVDLQSSGRMIGVISHVSEMKEQIGTLINVLRGPLGSQINLTLP